VAIVGQYGSVSQIAARGVMRNWIECTRRRRQPRPLSSPVRKTDGVTYDAFVIRTGYDHTAAKGLAP
jgi:hypothetical protein